MGLQARLGCPETGDDWLIVSFAVAIIGRTGLNGGIISALGIFMGSAIFMLILLAIVVDRVREIYSDRQKAR